MPESTSKLVCFLVASLMLSTVEAAEPRVRYRTLLDAAVAVEGAVSTPVSGVERATPSRSRYAFRPLTTPVDGHSQAFGPAINLREVLFVTNPEHPAVSNPHLNVLSSPRGYVTESKTGNLRFPDVNNRGEVVYADTHPGFGFGIFSTRGGLIRNRGNVPSVADTGEIVYVRHGPGGDSDPPWPPPTKTEIVSTVRGVLATGTAYGPGQVGDPHVNSSGEVIYTFSRAIVSTVRGTITDLWEDPLWPSLSNAGEIVYTAKDGALRQLFSSATGQVTYRDTFPEPHRSEATCTSPRGFYQGGVAGQTDVNDRGQIVFSRWLYDGPYPDPEFPEYCTYWGTLQIVVASPVRLGAAVLINPLPPE